MRGAREVHESVLKAHPEADLSVLIVWSPIMRSDDRESAEELARELDDPRAQFFWDAEMAVGKALKPKLEIGEAPFAWDVYCFFGADAEWGSDLPEPTKWAHQLGGADPSHYFGKRLGETLRSWTKELLGAEAGATEPAPLPEGLLMIRPEDLRPIPEVLLDKILGDLAKQADGEIDPKALAKIAVELRRRMADATKPHADALPKALLHDGKVLILAPGDCSIPSGSPGPGARKEAGRKKE